jgi:hypothetical protein
MTIKIIDCANLSEKPSVTVPAKFANLCVLSSDSSMVLNYDSGKLTICQLASGKMMSASLEKMTGGKSLGSIQWLGFTGDMKYICFSAASSFLAFEVSTMKPVKRIEGTFYQAEIKAGASDLIVADGQRQVWLFSEGFAKESKSAIGFPYDLASVDPGQKYLAVGSSDDYDAEVFSATDGTSVLKMPSDL